jgi:hypothetical protein
VVYSSWGTYLIDFHILVQEEELLVQRTILSHWCQRKLLLEILFVSWMVVESFHLFYEKMLTDIVSLELVMFMDFLSRVHLGRIRETGFYSPVSNVEDNTLNNQEGIVMSIIQGLKAPSTKHIH